MADGNNLSLLLLKLQNQHWTQNQIGSTSGEMIDMMQERRKRKNIHSEEGHKI